MEPQHPTSGIQAMHHEIFIGCSHEDLVAVDEMEAWKRGYEGGVADGPEAMKSLAAVEHASEAACGQALLVYVPMDLGRFRDIFSLAWCTGYWARVQESRVSLA
jgi:hypothetical protein